MASLIAPLVSGIAGAASGSAEFFRTGTATLATAYSDAEGVSATTSHPLDANGGVVRYVKERVDVVVYDVNRATVRTFTWGTDAREARLENLGFTGPDASGAVVAGGRTTVDAALTSLFGSFGATDGMVLVNGVATTLSSALNQSAGLVYNVKSGYGATGNGTTNDSAAVQAAINAADAAGGGIIFFPHGTYLLSSAITVANSTGKFFFLGEAASGSKLKQGTSGITMLSLGNSNQITLMNLTFTATAANTGTLVAVGSTARATFISCTFDPIDGTQVANAIAVTSKSNFVSCSFSLAGSSSKLATGGSSQARYVACDITTAGSGLTCFGTGMLLNFSACTLTLGGAEAAGTTVFAPSGTYLAWTGGFIFNNYTSGTVTLAVDCVFFNVSGAVVDSLGGATVALSSGTTAFNEAGVAFLDGGGGAPTIGDMSAAGSRSVARDHRRVVTSDSAITYTPNGSFGIHEYTSSGASMAIANPSPDIPTGSGLTILYKNTSGGTVTPSFGTAYSFVGARWAFDSFQGAAAAGAIGAGNMLVGDRVRFVSAIGPTLGDVGEDFGLFEGTITVNGQIQQTSATDLSANHYWVAVERLSGAASVETGKSAIFEFAPRFGSITTDLVCASVRPVGGTTI